MDLICEAGKTGGGSAAWQKFPLIFKVSRLSRPTPVADTREKHDAYVDNDHKGEPTCGFREAFVGLPKSNCKTASHQEGI
jgi:hypothetical protein